MARRSYPQSVPPPFADAGEYTRTTPPENSRPYQGDLMGSYGEARFGNPEFQNPNASPNYAGRGPKGWQRTDESIRDRICDLLDASPDVDAREIDVSVNDGQVTLEGHVENREAKRRAEDIVADLPGVNDVHNRLQIDQRLFEEVREHYRV